jgi:hypothetical protein
LNCISSSASDLSVWAIGFLIPGNWILMMAVKIILKR